MRKINDKPAILRLRRAMLFNVLGFIILFFGSVASYGYYNQLKDGGPSAIPILPVILLLVGAIMVLLSASNLYIGFKMMQHIDRVYNLGRYGDVIQYTGSALILLGLYFIIFSGNVSLQHIGPEVTLAGYLLGFIGTLPMAIAFYKLGKRHSASLVKAGAVVYFLIPVVGPALLYFGLRKIATK